MTRENRAGELTVPLSVATERIAEAERAFKVSRNDENLMTTTGLLYRDLPVGIRLKQIRDLDDLYAQVHEKVLGGIEHSCYPYEEIDVSGEKSISACVLYQRSLYSPIRVKGVTVTPVVVRQNRAASQTILDIMVLEGETGIVLHMDYIATLYEQKSMERFTDMLCRIVEQITEAAREGENREIGKMIERTREYAGLKEE